MSKSTNGFLAFVTGALIGSMVSILYAPRSGEETRHLLRENSKDIKEKTMKSIQEIQDAAQKSIEEMQDFADAMNKEARQRMEKIRNEMQKISEEGFENLEEQTEDEEILEPEAA